MTAVEASPPAHVEWTNEKLGDKVGEDQRLPETMD
jgi:hypothetical protein